MRVGKTPRRTSSWTCYVLSVSMILGFPGQGLVQAGGTAAPVATAGSLSVETDPAGAMVLVDGQSWGVTPLAERSIAPGDHRVRVVKEGYLDNSRVVSVQAGQSGRVQVKLTPQGKAPVREQVDTTAPPPQNEGGGSKKAILIGLGVVAVGAGAYLALRNTNKAPVAGTVVASPTTALQGATSVSFSAQGASDPDSDPLTYEWNFGDGSTGSGATTTHTYNTAGTMNVTVTVKDPKGLSATASGSVTVRSLAGAWSGTIVQFNAPFTTSFTQTGANVGGTFTIGGTALPGNAISGSVRAGNAMTLTFSASGFAPFTYNATIDTALNTITGTITGSGFTGETLRLSR
jgi:PKD repeat protein